MTSHIKTCEYCTRPAELLNFGDNGYPYQRAYGPLWACLRCEAWVGVHPGTTRPLGRLANYELRQAKQAAHAAFDPLWERKKVRESISRNKARKAGYQWLSDQLGIPVNKTHIGYFNTSQCAKVVEVCSKYNRRVIA